MSSLTTTLTSNLIMGLLPENVFRDRGMAPLDANDMVNAGLYRLDRPDTEDPALRKNYPSTACRALIAVFAVGNFCIHLFVAQATSASYIRLQWASGGWNPWKAIT